MPILHNVRQGSDAWDKLRLGIPTSSVFDRVWTPPSAKYPRGQQSKQWEDLAFTLLTERFLGYKMATYVSPHMEDGKEHEEEAADWYELTTHRVPVLIGFITNDAGTIGCSPDRLIGDDGLLEVKVPKAKTQMKYLIKGTIAVDYWPQLQGQLWISDRKWVDIVAYSQILPRCVIRVERDEPYIAKLAAELDKLVEYIEVCWEKIQEMAGRSNGAPKDPRQGDLGRLKAQLEASLAREDKARSAGNQGPGESRYCSYCSSPMRQDERGWYCSDPNCRLHWVTEPVPVSDAAAEYGAATVSRETAGEASANLASPLSEPADATPQPGIGGGGSSGRKGESPTQIWRCSCGGEFEIYGAFSRHRQRTGHKVDTAHRDPKRAEAVDPEPKPTEPAMRGVDVAGSSSEAEARQTGPAADQHGGPVRAPTGKPAETRREAGGSPALKEETFWDIAARTGDYKVEIPDKNIATIGRDQMMNLVADAPTVEALTAFYQGNLGTIETMGKARVASRNELVKAMTRRKKELGEG